MGLRMKVLLVHPGASWSTADVEAGLRHGLMAHGVEIVRYRLDTRFERSRSWLYACWRKAKKLNPQIVRPTTPDAVYQAGIGALEMALRHQVDVVLIVSAMILHPDVIIMMRRAGLRTAVLFTETPYDIDKELRIAEMVDGCWTHERAALSTFRAVNPNCGYLPHAWHPERHGPEIPIAAETASHDVVFVGSGFAERVTWFNAIDWTGIDLGLYGTWKGLGLKPSLQSALKAEQIDNAYAAGLYRRAKVGLNLYRTRSGFGKKGPELQHPAESLSPRAYELAACRAFHVSAYRQEIQEVFGDLVPTFTSPKEAEVQIRMWLANPDGRARVSAALPACVAESSWVQRAARVIGDLEALIRAKAA